MKFQEFYCDKAESEKSMEIIKKFRNRVREYMNRKSRKDSSQKQFNQLQFLSSKGRFSLNNS